MRTYANNIVIDSFNLLRGCVKIFGVFVFNWCLFFFLIMVLGFSIGVIDSVIAGEAIQKWLHIILFVLATLMVPYISYKQRGIIANPGLYRLLKKTEHRKSFNELKAWMSLFNLGLEFITCLLLNLSNKLVPLHSAEDIRKELFRSAVIFFGIGFLIIYLCNFFDANSNNIIPIPGIINNQAAKVFLVYCSLIFALFSTGCIFLLTFVVRLIKKTLLSHQEGKTYFAIFFRSLNIYTLATLFMVFAVQIILRPEILVVLIWHQKASMQVMLWIFAATSFIFMGVFIIFNYFLIPTVRFYGFRWKRAYVIATLIFILLFTLFPLLPITGSFIHVLNKSALLQYTAHYTSHC